MDGRTAARARRAFARAVTLSPGPAIVVVDVALRGHLLRDYSRAALAEYAGYALLSGCGWAALVVAAARRGHASRWGARALVAALAVLALGTQGQAWARYGSYLSWQTALWGTSLWPFVGHALPADRARAVGWLAGPCVAVLAVVAAAARLAPPRRRSGRSAFAVAAVCFALVALAARPRAGWTNGAPPDALWLNAVSALATSRVTHEDIMTELAWLPAARHPAHVPALHGSPARARNVLLLVDESLRADEACLGPDDSCATMARTRALLPNRFEFRVARALDSTTALSVAVLLGGVPPSEPRARLLSTPWLPEYARAAGLDAAMWTSQNLLFANYGRLLEGLPLTAQVNGTEIEPYATYETGADDAKLLERVLGELTSLREPYFGVVQLANTHFPYVVDARDLPFSSGASGRAADAYGSARLRYQDSLHRQDLLLARFFTELRSSPRGARTVVFFVSDHGEQIGERGQIGHTSGVYDEEVRVPMWIDGPPGTLSDAEEEKLRALRDTPVTELEVMPTVLDLMGVWDDPAIAAARARLAGVSLLRGGPPADRAVVLTNCSEIYSCATKNWGAVRGTRKLVGSGDAPGAWRCYDVATDSGERHDLGPAACGDLVAIAQGEGRGVPW
ncbi:MAG TPA: sulfatase-like hydrolase/transferase [Polyangiaceae bacterium]|nr:sulfatase-like hydrolase/transferase [Polyangiaceae bacterium]